MQNKGTDVCVEKYPQKDVPSKGTDVCMGLQYVLKGTCRAREQMWVWSSHQRGVLSKGADMCVCGAMSSKECDKNLHRRCVCVWSNVLKGICCVSNRCV